MFEMKSGNAWMFLQLYKTDEIFVACTKLWIYHELGFFMNLREKTDQEEGSA